MVAARNDCTSEAKNMDQTRKVRLEAGGIMVDEALERFMGNEAMLE